MFRSTLSKLAGCLVVSAILGGQTAALANPIYSASLLVQVVNANPGGTNDEFNSGVLNSTDTIALHTANNGQASASGYAQDGLLGAFATAQSLATDTIFIGASSQVTFVDTLTLTSTTLAVGTLVDLLLTLDLDVVLSSTQTPAMGGGCGSTGQGILRVYSGGGVNILANLTEERRPAPCQTILAAPEIISARIGDELLAILTLHALAGGRVGGGSTADALHTLRFFADPQGDFDYVTASGNSHRTIDAGVPEPSLWALLATTIPVAIARGRARRRQRPC